ncbi:acidic leucine-rich nuclear phosphoprotein 32-related protein [Lycium barbarum]|uniref:acidic leucine-rich nuclear phosphoprotein 32-related protein n=1 Tax=Lycium barbarum TaxID=112863 RepID=UPI00293ED8B4|nr:acidic leucine-rich nuclear phosphoprotein 32-related protein [Lycium barbarum]
MDEIWERAVETALDGETSFSSVKNLTLDGAVKCVHGKLPQPSIFERFTNLEHLSIANIGVSSLEQFPMLRNLQKLILSDNRIAGGVEFLVDAGLNSLRDLDLSNNRINDIDDLRPLAELRLVSLDLYECPVTRVKDYRSRVFGLIKSLKYLDKMDLEGNERPESDDEEDEDEDEDDNEDDVDDPGSGEVDGEDRPSNGHSRVRVGSEGVVDVDEDESDADEEEMEITRAINGSKSQENGVLDEEGDDDEDEDDEDEDFVEEIDEDGDDEDDVVEVHEIEDSDDEEDGVEDDEDDDDDDDEDEDEEEVDNDEGDGEEPESTTGRLNSTEGEIDGHEHGEDEADEDDDGETGEEVHGVEEEDGDFDDNDDEDAEDEEEDNGNGYLVQPVGPVEVEDDAEGSDMEPVNGDEDPDLEEDIEDEEDDYGEVQELPPSSSSKRKRDDEEDDGEEDDEEFAKSSKHR